MRRKDREVTDLNDIYSIIKKCDSVCVAFFDEEYPYVIPLNFGVSFKDNKFTLYFHGASQGKKLDLIKKNNHVSFTMSTSHKLKLGEKSCDATMDFESVCGSGIVSLLDDEEKKQSLTFLMEQYDNGAEHSFDDKEVERIAVLKLEVERVTGKRH
ncbi:MAG: pyridoxamine 5'-phosphate oxidase family protein [Oscillospiraceae bacterium]|nr:pyridoxamine 5'-phosphate oxidase family protein [Oscillospiraceae bacterium]